MKTYGRGRRGSSETPHRKWQRRRQRGIALVAVLWGVVLLAVIAGSFTVTARTDSRLVRNLVENAKAESLAEAGIHLALLRLLDARDTQSWRADGSPQMVSFDGTRLTLAIQDEGGKIDLNRAPDALLKGLIRSVGVDEERSSALVDAIADWRDGDDFRRLNGAEEADYHAAGLAYGPKNSSFQIVEELEQVMGMTPGLYEKVAPSLTVHSRRPGVDPETAPREVLDALPGVLAADVEALLAARAFAAEGGPVVARSLTGVESFMSRSRKRIYSLRAEVRTASGAVFVREAVVQLTRAPRSPYRFLAWTRGKRKDFGDDLQ